jgi:16S rRNA (guanine966-N2)-methyltransferase
MKITAGYYKGQNILVPKFGVKPTTDKVRQALFNALQPRINGSRFLDLYCGTGAIGIEALSNGAAFVCFVENASRVYQVLKKNLESIVADKSSYMTLKHNSLSLQELFLEKNFKPFDIIFADPFYADADEHFEDLYHLALSFLTSNGIFILEHGNKTSFKDYPSFLEEKKYGDTVLTLFSKTVGSLTL